jgi:hypothetical protein
MSKNEILEGLKAKGIFDVTGNRDPLWQEAFKLYQIETKQKLSPSCGSCYNRLRSWLKA